MSLIRNITAGAVGGFAGGLAMFVVRTIGIEGDIIQVTLPDKYEQGIERILGFAHETNAREEKQLTIVEHLTLSALLGVIYGILRGLFRPRSLPSGLAYASGVYMVMVGFVGPMLGITRAPWSKPARATGGELLNHLLFGSVTALVTSRIRD